MRIMPPGHAEDAGDERRDERGCGQDRREQGGGHGLGARGLGLHAQCTAPASLQRGRSRRRSSRARRAPRACARPAAARRGATAPGVSRELDRQAQRLHARRRFACSTSTTISRAATCGSASISPMRVDRPHGHARRLERARSSRPRCACAGARRSSGVSAARLRMRSPLVRKRASSASSGRPITFTMRSQLAWLAPPTLIQPSARGKRLVGRGEDVRRARRARDSRRWRSRSPTASRSAGSPLP